MDFDPLTCDEEQEPEEEVTLEDARFPGGQLVIRLRRLGEVGVTAAEDYIDQMVMKYVTGDEVEGTPPVLFDHRGKKYRLNKALIRGIAYLLIMQQQEPKHDFAFYLGLCKNFSSQFRKLRRRGYKLMEELREARADTEELPNPFAGPADAEEAGCSASSSISDNGTRTSKRARTTPSVASLTG